MSLCPLHFITWAGHGAGKKLNWQSCPQVTAVFLLLCLWHHFSWCHVPFPGLGGVEEQAGDLCCQGQVALTAWAVKLSISPGRTLGRVHLGWAQSTHSDPHARAGMGWAEPWLKWQQVMSQYHLPLLCCRSVILHLLQDKSLRSLLQRIETLIPNWLGWAQQACFQSKACSPWVNFPFNFSSKILQQMALNAVSVCNCSFWCVSRNEP